MPSQSFQFVMQKGPNPGKIYELMQDEITIGRDISNRLVINDPEVSRRHARLTAQSGGYVIEDLGSTNGVFIDGQRLMGPHLLRPGQVVMLGEKIALAYEALGFDPNVTQASASGPATTPSAGRETYRVESDYEAPPGPPPISEPAYSPQQMEPPAPQAYPPPPAYAGQVPPGPATTEYIDMGAEIIEEEEEPAGRSRTMLIAGCVVLLVMACCLVVGLFAFDYLNLYCETPFNALSGVLWSCPP